MLLVSCQSLGMQDASTALRLVWAARLHIAAGRQELGLDFIAAQTQALLSGGL